MKLVKNPLNRDIAYHIVTKKDDLYFVEIYNVNFSKIGGGKPLFICADWMKLKDVDKFVEWKNEV